MVDPIYGIACPIALVSWAQAVAIPEMEMPEFTIALVAKKSGVDVKVGYGGLRAASFFPVGVLSTAEARERFVYHLNMEVECLLEAAERLGKTEDYCGAEVVIDMTAPLPKEGKKKDIVGLLPPAPGKEEPPRTWKTTTLNVKPPFLGSRWTKGQALGYEKVPVSWAFPR